MSSAVYSVFSGSSVADVATTSWSARDDVNTSCDGVLSGRAYSLTVGSGKKDSSGIVGALKLKLPAGPTAAARSPRLILLVFNEWGDKWAYFVVKNAQNFHPVRRPFYLLCHYYRLIRNRCRFRCNWTR